MTQAAVSIPTLHELVPANVLQRIEQQRAILHASQRKWRMALKQNCMVSEQNCLCICEEISLYACDAWSGVQVEFCEGYFCGPEVKGDEWYEHCWNRLPNGSILDCSADQFGWAGIVVIGPDDPRYKYYVTYVEFHNLHDHASEF